MTTLKLHNIFENKKYPPFIKNHKIFKQIDKVHKIFPLIGLDNCEEDVVIDNSGEIEALGVILVSHITVELDRVRYNTYYDEEGSYIARLMTGLRNCIVGANNCVVSSGSRTTLNLPYDVLVDGKVVFKKGSGLFKVYNKVANLIIESGKTTIQRLQNLDALPAFKNFSSANIPNAKHKLVFSSAGENGLWDIATMSMRGIASCQTWTSSHSANLVGSMVDPFTGIMYITSGNIHDDLGSKMIRRCIVRFVVNTKTRKQSLMMEKMYPSHDKNIADTFKKFLSNKVGKKYTIVDATEKIQKVKTHYTPSSNTIRKLPPVNKPYCDSGVQYSTDAKDANGIKDEQLKLLMDGLPAWIGVKIIAAFRTIPKASLKCQKYYTTISAIHFYLSYIIYDNILRYTSDLLTRPLTSNDHDHKLQTFMKKADVHIFSTIQQSIMQPIKNNQLPILPKSIITTISDKVVKSLKKEIDARYKEINKAIDKKVSDKNPLYIQLLTQ